MAETKRAELLGASGSLRLTGKEARTSVPLDRAIQRSVMFGATQHEPDRIFLNLEGVRGVNDATVLSVYINVPYREDPAKHSEFKVGDVALYGLHNASLKDDKHAGDGMTLVLDITDVIHRLYLLGGLSANQIHVRLVPRHPVPDEAPISIGRVSVFRQPT